MPENHNTINNTTEKKFRDEQTTFGHLHRDQGLDVWLKNMYEVDAVRQARYKRVAEDFLANKTALKVLEIAAGVGDFVMYCEKLFPQHEYFANELSETQLKGNIQEVARHFGVRVMPSLAFGPVENLEYEDNSFDVVFIKAAVHHFENPEQGLTEIYRVLKPGGVLVCFEEPVCLNIPIYMWWRKKNFALEERSLGLNEHIYTIEDYLRFGKIFERRVATIDKVLVAEFGRQQEKRTGIKKIIGSIVRNHPLFFRSYMIWRFSPVIFVFTKK